MDDLNFVNHDGSPRCWSRCYRVWPSSTSVREVSLFYLLFLQTCGGTPSPKHCVFRVMGRTKNHLIVLFTGLVMSFSDDTRLTNIRMIGWRS